MLARLSELLPNNTKKVFKMITKLAFKDENLSMNSPVSND